MKKHQPANETEKLETLALSTTNVFGSIWSILVRTILFVGAFVFIITGSDLNRVLLALTTFVSLEAIYLSILIKMGSNQQTKTLERVEKDMEAIVDDVEEMKKDVEEIREDVENVQTEHDQVHKI